MYCSEQITKKTQIEAFEDKLDKLYDITKCQCKIETCDEVACPGKWQNSQGKEVVCPGAHITCQCVHEEKLPVIDLKFLKSQRQKCGEKGTIVMGGMPDKVTKVKCHRQDA